MPAPSEGAPGTPRLSEAFRERMRTAAFEKHAAEFLFGQLQCLPSRVAQLATVMAQPRFHTPAMGFRLLAAAREAQHRGTNDSAHLVELTLAVARLNLLGNGGDSLGMDLMAWAQLLKAREEDAAGDRQSASECLEKSVRAARRGSGDAELFDALESHGRREVGRQRRGSMAVATVTRRGDSEVPRML